MRKITFEQACSRYVHRYTMDHVPTWSRKPVEMTINGKGPHFYAPQFESDREWYDSTIFSGERGYPFGKRDTGCYTHGQTWPIGQWLLRPYKGRAAYRSADDSSLSVDQRRRFEIDRAKDDCGGEAA